MNEIEICEYDLPKKGNGKNGKMAILRGGLNSNDPVSVMDNAVSNYVGNKPYNDFVEVFLDNPHVRVIIENINELDYEKLDGHKL